MTIINLILYDPRSAHEVRMKQELERYLSWKNEIPFWFYCFQEDQATEIEIDSSTHLLTFRGKEEYTLGILEKTIRAVEWTLRNYSTSVTYILRSNISTFLDLDQWIPFLHQLPEGHLDYSGCAWNAWPSPFDPLSGFTHEKAKQFGYPPFASGTCLVFSRRAAAFLVERRDLLVQTIGCVDDLAIGILMHCDPEAIRLFPTSRKPLSFWIPSARCLAINTLSTSPACFAYRNKRADRFEDVIAISRLVYLHSDRQILR